MSMNSRRAALSKLAGVTVAFSTASSAVGRETAQPGSPEYYTAVYNALAGGCLPVAVSYTHLTLPTKA